MLTGQPDIVANVEGNVTPALVRLPLHGISSLAQLLANKLKTTHTGLKEVLSGLNLAVV